MRVAAEFVTSAAGPGDFPVDRLAEVAFVGRSNVGKSSLINALVRQSVARTSAAPGKTRLVNFFRVRRGTAPALLLVDLPGYGYARGKDTASQAFQCLTEAYFARAVRRAVILLIDARHPGLEADLEAWEWLRSRPDPVGVVGTKADKLTRAERTRHARELESLFAAPVLLVSAQTGEGLDDLWTLIDRLPRPPAT